MSDEPFHQQGSPQSTRDVAVEETKSVGHDAKEGAKQVAQTAGAEAQAVVGEARAQVTSLYDNLRQEVTGQARDQTQRASAGLQNFAGELNQMAEGSSESGMASGVVRQVAERVDAAAGWLEGREPGDLLEEVRRYARRSPGTFLAACAVIGFVGGRLTRGLRDEADQQERQTSGTGRQGVMPSATAPAPEPMTFEGGYGGRPGAVPGGATDTTGTPGGLGAATTGPVGTAAGNPLPGGPGGDPGREAREPATIVGDGEDVYLEDGERVARDPFADAPDLGQGSVGSGASHDEGDRR